jgi:uncharacterized membrane protein
MSTNPSGSVNMPPSGAEPVYGPAYTGNSGASAPPPSASSAPYGESPRYTAPYPPYPSDIPSAPGIAPNIAAGLAYFTVLPAVVFLLVEPYRSEPLVRFHSWQSVFFFVAMAAIRVVEMMLLAMLPAAIAYAAAGLVSLLLFICWLIVVIKAFQGTKWLVPFIGAYADRTAEAGRRA